MRYMLRLEEENQTPRLFDALYPFRQSNAEGASKIDANRTLLREQPSRTKWVRNRREQFVQHQHLLRRLVRAAPAANIGDEDVDEDGDGDEVDNDSATTRTRKRKRRAAASSSSPSSTTSTSATTSGLWEEAARLLPTPFALEKGTLRSLRDLNTRVGLEVVRNTQPPRGAHQLAQHLAHAYPVLMGPLALERAFTLAGQSRWRDAYDSLEK
ncbi:uncharacterized protein ACA1_393510 [Acanthamoeba castellanii str. Neff]|uniref:Uncharacterized protein n=1 Tax=Acanthamoeba castellanii (strain ATCC 30010 / Neff) TaxID=1257118 RepID=L8H0B5_ACACF|nr:uncharacterized protein ACA1_393510 [Acanthamoeba castellanii str. Neff]ELR18665.1 hypothetical protein ACA1_393510 [Acanthamoeba castellanii str. Neff]